MITSVLDVAWLFLKLGFTAFGGPAAHIAMYRDEVVTRRQWLTDQEFLDLLGVTNLIPGPNSTEMAIHIGLRRAGWAGFLLAGLCFILPASGIVLVLAWFYVRYGSAPQAGWLLAGVQPVVIAIILQAFWGLGRKAVKGALTALAGVAALALYFVNLHPVLILLICGLVVMLVENFRLPGKVDLTPVLIPINIIPMIAAVTVPFSLGILFLTFLKIGTVLYGSGYVLLAFLHADFVTRLGWLTDSQLIDAIAIGQVTPGPVFTTATFIGYLLGGVPGAVLGTLGIFLPSFVFVALSSQFIPRIRGSRWLGSLLDGVNVASLGLMAGVTWQLARASLVHPVSFAILVLSGILILKYNINTTWLILAGALSGFLFHLG
jgi:chromate transporter